MGLTSICLVVMVKKISKGFNMKMVRLLSVALIWPIFLAACANSGAGQMTPEKFKDMYAMLLKLDELKKKEIITEAEFLEQKTKLLGN